MIVCNLFAYISCKYVYISVHYCLHAFNHIDIIYYYVIVCICSSEICKKNVISCYEFITNLIMFQQ